MQDWAWNIGDSGNMLNLNIKLKAADSDYKKLFKQLPQIKTVDYTWYAPNSDGYGAFLYSEIFAKLQRWYQRFLPDGEPVTDLQMNYSDPLFYVTFNPVFCQFGRSWGDDIVADSDSKILQTLLSSKVEFDNWSVQDGDYGNIVDSGNGKKSLRDYLA